MDISTDYLVIGGGVAGLLFALEVADTGTVALVTKREKEESNTRYAQGGIAAVLGDDDSPRSHLKDTLEAGCGLCHESVVDFTVREGPDRLWELIEYGANFTKSNSGVAPSLDLGREGGHSARRIVHAQDVTGREIVRALLAAASKHQNIVFYEYHMAIDLITGRKMGLNHDEENRCLGAYVLDVKNNQVLTFSTPVTCLCTGGAGKVYLYTSNPDVASGDGVAMAYRAGATVANLEFFQFHPTCLYHPQAKSFLVSETLRGEGGILRLPDGEPFMERFHKLKDLAPRDIVARAIDHEMKRLGLDNVFLDVTHWPAGFATERFPNIHRRCLELGIDMAKEPLPVVPAAHYSCGGVNTNEHGETDIPGLLAVGEVAHTGLHGANRLASNSLLEALVFAHRAAARAQELGKFHGDKMPEVPIWDAGDAVDSDEMVVVSQNWDEIRRFMWNYVGIVRTNKRLARARRRIKILLEEIHRYYWDFLITGDLIELRNIATVAALIIESAQLRKESRGLHYNLDYAGQDAQLSQQDTRLKKSS